MADNDRYKVTCQTCGDIGARRVNAQARDAAFMHARHHRAMGTEGEHGCTVTADGRTVYAVDADERETCESAWADHVDNHRVTGDHVSACAYCSALHADDD